MMLLSSSHNLQSTALSKQLQLNNQTLKPLHLQYPNRYTTILLYHQIPKSQKVIEFTCNYFTGFYSLLANDRFVAVDGYFRVFFAVAIRSKSIDNVLSTTTSIYRSKGWTTRLLMSLLLLLLLLQIKLLSSSIW